MGLISVTVGPDDGSVRGPSTGHRGRARALERNNNPLPWRIGALSAGALECLDAALMAACRHPQRLLDNELAGAFLLHVMLVTGRSPQKLSTARIFDREPKMLRSRDPEGLYRGTKNWAWWLKQGSPSSAQLMRKASRANYRRTDDEVLLWCGDRTKLLLELALDRRCLELTPDAVSDGFTLTPKMGTWSPAAVRALSSAFLKTLPVAERVALTQKRVETWLFQAISDATGDVALASILTNTTGAISDATVHYTWMSRKQVFEMHFNHVERFERLASTAEACAVKSGNPAYPHLSTLQGKTDAGHGSRYVPRPEIVEDLANAFYAELRGANQRPRSERELSQFHNAFTLHTIALIGFATGLRSVVNPVPSMGSIDQASGFVILNDKGEADPLRDRLSWLPACALQQIRYYRAHMLALPHQFAHLRISHLFDAELLKARRPDRQAVVLLDPDLGVRSSTRSLVAKAFGLKGFPIQMNAWRHYLRTELVGVLPGDVLHAFLGHWQRGQEPWSSYSCLDPQSYRKALCAPLETLMARDGWEALEGYKTARASSR